MAKNFRVGDVVLHPLPLCIIKSFMKNVLKSKKQYSLPLFNNHQIRYTSLAENEETPIL